MFSDIFLADVRPQNLYIDELFMGRDNHSYSFSNPYGFLLYCLLTKSIFVRWAYGLWAILRSSGHTFLGTGLVQSRAGCRELMRFLSASITKLAFRVQNNLLLLLVMINSISIIFIAKNSRSIMSASDHS